MMTLEQYLGIAVIWGLLHVWMFTSGRGMSFAFWSNLQRRTPLFRNSFLIIVSVLVGAVWPTSVLGAMILFAYKTMKSRGGHG